uniref:Uncharacterized protein n=1 Tax=Oryza glumipatula TaxID=40148 RepID=A0A0D9ZQ28_9ORYZ
MPVEPATATTVVLPVAEPDPDSRHDAAVAAAEEPVHGEADEEDEDEMASSRTSSEGWEQNSSDGERRMGVKSFCFHLERLVRDVHVCQALQQAQQLVLRL